MPEEHAAENKGLLQEAKNGSTQAFGELYEQYAPRIFRFLYAHLDNRLDAEDLTEEVFLKAWRALPKYQEKGLPFTAFLFRIAQNTLTDYYRRTTRPGREILHEDIPDNNPKNELVEVVLAKLEQQELRRLLLELREDYRTVLVARFLSDLSPEETAQMMGKTPGAVRVLQHRALAAMRKLFEEKASGKREFGENPYPRNI
jgi:RNA polymerase sigma-70 factor, ECF subfamily